MAVDDVVLWMQLLNTAWLLVGSIWGVVQIRAKANGEAIQHIAATLADESRRIDRLIERFDAGPNHADLARIYERVNAVAESQREMAGSLTALAQSVQMIHRHLLRDDT